MSRTSPNKILRKPPFDSDRQSIDDLVNQGKSDSHIAAVYNVTKDTIWCRRMRWNLPSGWEVKEKRLKEDMTELWKNSYSVQEIAAVCGVSLQAVYTKMREYKIRDVPRLGIDAPNMSLTELRQSMTGDTIDDEAVIVVTHNRHPKWALVPIEQYQDLVSGMYQTLRGEQE